MRYLPDVGLVLDWLAGLQMVCRWFGWLWLVWIICAWFGWFVGGFEFYS